MLSRIAKVALSVVILPAVSSFSCSYVLPGNEAAAAGLLLSLVPETPNSFTWANQQVSLDIGGEGTYDTAGVSNPSVILDGSLYRMWYTGSDGANNRILYAESTDGVNWTNHQLAFDLNQSGTGQDSTRVYLPSVIKEGNVYKIWYSAGGVNVRTLYAESTDAFNWSNYQTALDINNIGTDVDDRHAFNARVVSGYRIYYTAVNTVDDYQIATCSSTDGITFSSCQLTIPPNTEGTHDQRRTNSVEAIQYLGRHYAWYGGSSTEAFNFDMLACDSDDGITWSNCELAFARNTQGTYDTASVDAGAVIVENGVARIWYSGSDGSTSRILYAESLF